jgi:hypothetical protein
VRRPDVRLAGQPRHCLKKDTANARLRIRGKWHWSAGCGDVYASQSC